MILYYAKTDGRDSDQVLRHMLKQALGAETCQRTKTGKPMLEKQSFSFSCNGSLAVLLVDDCDCGVDAESLDSKGTAEPKDVLTDNELMWLQDQLHNYMTLWTRKQAALKAAGDMAIPAKSLDVLGRDNSITLNGVRYFLGSYAIHGCVVSWASQHFAMPELQQITL